MNENEYGLASRNCPASSHLAGSATVLAFDFGEKYTGVAVGESGVGVAHPLGLIAARSSATRMVEAAALVAEWKPGILVVGLPLSMDGAEHDLTRRSRRFARQLEARFNLPVKLVDERLSSAAAEDALKTARAGGRKHKLRTHQVSAQIILQSYFDDTGTS
jgi:putative Holliday junction resolvase